MRCLPILLALGAAAIGQTRVEIRQNEVWAVSGDHAKQLTRDGISKLQAIYSARYNRVAYYNACTEGEACTTSVILLDPDGNHLQSFVPSPSALGGASPCGSILDIFWTADDRNLGIVCHYNPSLSEYVEIDLASGKTVRDLAGLRFTPSPSGDHIAWVAPIMHFAPRYRQSEYLLIDGLTTYPLPRGTKPRDEKLSDAPIDVVHRKGSVFLGIHEFVSPFSWSPDSSRVAFVDCVFDWRETVSDQINQRCSVAVVGLRGRFQLFSLPPDLELYGFAPAERLRLTWQGRNVVLTGPAHLSFPVR